MYSIFKFRRGNTAFNNSIVGSEGELFIDLQTKEIVIHDGIKQGGFRVGSGFGVDQVARHEANLALVVAQSAQNTANAAYEYANTVAHIDLSGYATINSLSSVATSGDYNDLLNLPVIPVVPSNVSSFINDSGYITINQVPQTYSNNNVASYLPTYGGDILSNTVIFSDGSRQNTAYLGPQDLSLYATKSEVNANTSYFIDALNATNSNIVLANTQLKAYVDGQDNNILSYVSGVDNSQNTRLSIVENTTIYLQGALNQANSNIVSSNTQLKSYVDGYIDYNNTINNTQNTNIQTSTNLAQGAYDTANLKFNTSGGNITGPVTISANVVITGNLTVSGNVTTISANNLSVEDNMIYLNSGSVVANPDLGIVGNYNDGTYHHAGFFRDSSDGVWKVFDNYLPEPDESPYIDTSNVSFRIADFQANNVTFGKINTSSSVLVTNLNADLLDGQHASYFAVASEQNGINATQNTNITNTQTWLDANISYLSGVNNTQNTNINTATNLAQGAYDRANTDYTTISTTAGVYGGASVIPVITLAANGRVSLITNTSITIPVSYTNSNVAVFLASFGANSILTTGNVSATYIIGSVLPSNSSTASSVGYLGVPQNSQSTNYTLQLTDAGQHIYVTANNTLTIPANSVTSFPVGTTISVITNGTSTSNIAINTDTLYLGGVGTTGTRTVSPFGMATIMKVTNTSWYISGAGVG